MLEMGYPSVPAKKQESAKNEGDPQLVVEGWERVGETKDLEWTRVVDGRDD